MNQYYPFKTSFLIAIIMLANLAVFSTEFKVKSFEKDDNDLAARRFDRKDINGEACALIKIKTDLQGLIFESGFGIVGDVLFKKGQYWVYVSAREQRLSIIKKGIVRLDYDIPLPVHAYDVFNMVLTTNAKINNKLPVTFVVDPADADIKVNEKPIENKKPIDLNLGEHQLSVIRDGFKPISKKVTVTKQNVYFEFEMEEVEKVAVTIKSIPEEAVVIMDGVEIGKTPTSTFYEPGQYPIELRKEGHIPISETIEISDPETIKTYQFQESVGYLKVISHEDATVTFNDEKVEANKSIKLVPSLVNVKAFMAKADTLYETIIIRKGDDKTINMIPELKTGAIQVSVTPFDAKVKLEGDAGERFESTGIKKFKDIPIGTYHLDVSKKEYIPYSTTLFLKRDSLIEKEVKLKGKKIVVISSDPEGADVYIGNRILGKSPVQVKLSPGKYKIKFSKANYQPYFGHFEVDQNIDSVVRKLERKNIKVKIITKPENTTLKLNDTIVTGTPLDTLLRPGKYKLSFSKPKHVKINRKIKVKTKPISKKFRVKRKGFFAMGYSEGIGSKGGEMVINGGRVVFGIQVTDLPTYNTDINNFKTRDNSFVNHNQSLLSEPLIKVDGDQAVTFNNGVAFNGKIGLAFYYPLPITIYGGYGMRMFSNFQELYQVKQNFNQNNDNTWEYEQGDFISTGSTNKTFYSPLVGATLTLRLGYWGGLYFGADYWFEPEKPQRDDQISMNAGLFFALD